MTPARSPSRLSGALAIGFALGLLLAACGSASGQIVSPGKLSAAHTELNGLRNCTSCHELGKRGISTEKCLDCHRPLGRRLAEKSGFHAEVGDQSCSDCHVEHFGEEFQLVRFDTSGFDHESMGYRLEEGHAKAECRDCHNALLVTDPEVREFKGNNGALNRTFLGLGAACLGCHESKSPHADQFAGRACNDCHNARMWEKAELYDHDDARYRLTGRHRQVACAGCHPAVRTRAGTQVRFVELAFTGCESCHTDVHNGVMAEACSGCHDTRGWHQVDRSRIEEGFDHATTGYRLLGAHGRLECQNCHGTPPTHSSDVLVRFAEGTESYAYPRPLAADCLACHRDHHEAAFLESPGGALCESCHGEEAWTPTRYDIERHNRETFELTGAHVAVPCLLCHGAPDEEDDDASLRFQFESTACTTCHRSDDPHRGQFEGQACTACHDTESFRVTGFDHDLTRYPLDGAHRDVACEACHVEEETADGLLLRRYKPIGTLCRDCH